MTGFSMDSAKAIMVYSSILAVFITSMTFDTFLLYLTVAG